MHALVRDETGAKMSKSKGNVIDPLDMVEEHSADIIRFTLAYLAVQGRDIKLGEKNLEQFRNFTNKLYNAANFFIMNLENKNEADGTNFPIVFADLDEVEIRTPLGKYMQTKLSTATDLVRSALESYKFNDAASILYNFVWNEFCDWGIEYSKASKESVNELGAIFKETLKLISPFMPFISDYLYHKLSGTTLEEGDSVMVMSFPKNGDTFPDEESMFIVIEEMITTIRRAKVVIDMGNSKIAKIYIKSDFLKDYETAKPFISKLAKVENVEFVNEKVDNSITELGKTFEVYLPTDEIDMSPIISKLTKQQEKTQKEVDKLNGMLSNERFVANAPESVIIQNRKALLEASNKLVKIQNELKAIS
ncbi:MAG: class I tRNA ligase family protein, partial [Campylobacteraceae bacterium]|nr:class I tRNA ligase family protein [Campylobacteraceae bacterium]